MLKNLETRNFHRICNLVIPRGGTLQNLYEYQDFRNLCFVHSAVIKQKKNGSLLQIYCRFYFKVRANLLRNSIVSVMVSSVGSCFVRNKKNDL